jgi:anti-sigma regulatory factor (Ser/Thr protein kinase)
MRPDLVVAAPRKRERFRRHPEQVAAARRFVSEMLARGSDARETARLLVSETVTSMLDQAPYGRGNGSFEITCMVEQRRLHVEVSDDGGPARLRRRVHQVHSGRGRGLQLVRALSSRWGVREDPAGRTIWFELDLPGPR